MDMVIIFSFFYWGGYVGTCLVWIVSKWLNNCNYPWVATISKGTIIILGFHMNFIKLFEFFEPEHNKCLDFLFALLIVFFFVPIIRYAENYFPYIIGIYRVK